MTPQNAEIIALKALEWLIGEEEICNTFLGATGMAQSDLSARATEAVFLSAVLEFICMNDEWVIAFCHAQALAYDVPMQAAQNLPGGERTHWT